eukprot:CAMPEP_0197851094 /NCGR_PEP_ID=MMETSP1438-20131217/17239_1 /TAXON_ID=1461541 /ORGANISM="Pterosperma sp., Strain CCMP1384" /LENGTH=323 /DNA_ID=CAMNT_0043464571 /DNA_START=269 /DNA_END=1236 /DNA_ORIENTATION=+
MLASIKNFKKESLRPTQTRVTHDAVISSADSGPKRVWKKQSTGRWTLDEEIVRLQTTHAAAHGRLGQRSWRYPVRVVECDAEARPGYDTCKAHEYTEDPEVLLEKVALLSQLLKMSERCVAYTGAGISTASGIADYATQAGTRSLVSREAAGAPVMASPWLARPTITHRVLVDLYHRKILKSWVQQNHDGLPQKAGLPQHAINEIHGAWFDPSNPVVKMSGNLREDLYSHLLELEAGCDLCLALGTSLSGMNADRIAISTAERHRQTGLGLVIIALQQTQLDDRCCLRIFAPMDEVFTALHNHLVNDPTFPLPTPSPPYPTFP